MAISIKQQSWQEFETWCALRGLNAAPANPWTLAAYIRFIEKSMRPAALKRHVGHIGQVHFDKLRKRPDRDPLVKRTIESVEARAAENKHRQTVPALFDADDFLEEKPAKSRRAARKKAPGAPPEKKGLRAEPPLVRRKKI